VSSGAAPAKVAVNFEFKQGHTLEGVSTGEPVFQEVTANGVELASAFEGRGVALTDEDYENARSQAVSGAGAALELDTPRSTFALWRHGGTMQLWPTVEAVVRPTMRALTQIRQKPVGSSGAQAAAPGSFRRMSGPCGVAEPQREARGRLERRSLPRRTRALQDPERAADATHCAISVVRRATLRI
jgi:hypothetical protein